MISIEEEEKLLEEGIKGHIIEMAFENNATHVLQKIICCMSEAKLEYLFIPICKHFIELSLDANGLCVIKKFIGKFRN